MVRNSKGYHHGTRDLFARPFRKHGTIKLSTYLRTYKRGDYVDIVGHGAVQKGMPHKYYHGRTGRVFNVSAHGLGIIVNKRVRHRVIQKRINVRVEHVKPSKCKDDFKKRVQTNDANHRKAAAKGEKTKSLKRLPAGPKPAHVVNGDVPPIELAPIPYEFIA